MLKNCEKCSKSFNPKREVQKYCSIVCYRSLGKINPMVKCKHCDNLFRGYSERKTYCSLNCFREHTKKPPKKTVKILNLRWEVLKKIRPDLINDMEKIEARLPTRGEI